MINHEDGVKASPECTEAHVGATVACLRALVTWGWDDAVAEEYVPLRTKVLEMSLEVDDAEEHGLWAFSDGEQSTGQRLTLKMVSILPRAGVRACSNGVASCLQARW